MRHAYKSDASVFPPPISEGNDPGFPTDGDPANGIPPTEIGSYVVHSIVSEIVNVITAAGLTPDGDDLTQLRQAVGMILTTRITALRNSIGTPFEFASRNEHIAAMPPDDEAANPADARFAINAYLEARA